MNVNTFDTSGYDARFYRRIKRHQHVLVVNKKNMINHTLAVVFFVCWIKVEAVKEEGIRARGKQFYVLAPCHVDFMSHFYWLVSKNGSYQQTHCAMIILYRRFLWSQDCDNGRLWTSLTVWHKSHDQRNHHDCFTMSIFRLGLQKIMQCV